jgi:phosphate transport system permease protein
MTEHTNIAAHNQMVREKIIECVLMLTALVSAVTVVFILSYLIYTALPAFTEVGISGFLFNVDWSPTSSVPSYGVAALIIDTLLVTLGALVLAIPLGIATAVYLSYLANPKIRDTVKPIIELLAGIPSVVYGFFGMVVLCNFLRTTLDIPSGFSWLAASMILGIMALPTIISISEDALFAIPRDYKEAGLSLGATYWYTISRVLLPAAASGISAAIVLGMGRAIGETMAVMMIAGNAAIIPEPIWNILSPVRTLTATLGIEVTEVARESMHYHALFGVAVILLIITLIVNLSSIWIIRRTQTRQMPNRHISSKSEKWLKSFAMIVICAVLFYFLATVLNIHSAMIIATVIIIWHFGRTKIPHKIAELSSFGIIYACTIVIILILTIILWDIFSNGLPAVTWTFLTGEGGVYLAIIGTLQLVGGAIFIALPIEIGAAIYLIEYSRENILTRTLRTGTDLLNGTPSIVFGLFGFAFFVIYLKWGVCMLAGQVCLALMILPTIARITEEALKSVPNELREASLSLGATKWQTIRKIVLPSAAPGILTGTILSIGRAAGETAPIMFTAVVLSKRFVTMNIFDPVIALPFHLYALSTNTPGATTQQYATAVVLIILVMIIYLAAVLLRKHFQQKLLR